MQNEIVKKLKLKCLTKIDEQQVAAKKRQDTKSEQQKLEEQEAALEGMAEDEKEQVLEQKKEDALDDILL